MVVRGPSDPATPEPLAKLLDLVRLRVVAPVRLEPELEHHDQAQAHFCHGAGHLVNRFGAAFLALAFMIKTLLFFSALVVVERASRLLAPPPLVAQAVP